MKFFVPGLPKPQGSKRAFVNPKTNRAIIVEDNSGTRDWRADVKAFAREAMGKKSLLDGPVAINLQFVMKRPLSTSKTKPTPPAIKRPDVDKLTRSILDSLSGTIYSDDSQVVSLYATKRIAELGEPTGCLIAIGRTDDDDSA